MFNQSQKRKGGDICAIFVHAGAGYHSTENEALHLKACADAAKAGMAVLRNGGSSLDAVEMAVRVLEDKEITNAGYGSNLAMDGTVECDATIVDYLGRSGAVGAVSQIRNPISLARLVLEQTLTPLSLHRVAPNLLVAQGATDFAFEKRVAIHPHDALISPGARERWRRWKQDLINAVDQNNRPSGAYSEDEITAQEYEYEEQTRQRLRKEHTLQMERERLSSRRHLSFSTPDSPTSSFSLPTAESPEPPGAPAHVRQYSDSPTQFEGVRGVIGIGYGPLAEAPISPYSPSVLDPGIAGPYAISERNSQVDGEVREIDEMKVKTNLVRNDGSSDSETCSSPDTTLVLPSTSPSPPPFAALHTPLPPSPPEKLEIYSPSPPADFNSSSTGLAPSLSYPVATPPMRSGIRGCSDDRITDTVGAVAIDCSGRIAAGSSSGGIGMKHRGRVGPAALVGIGTAVVPARHDDPQKMAVACVTSGTGEHMATTQAAARCAERIYNVGKVKWRGKMDTDEDEAMKLMIEQDFMG